MHYGIDDTSDKFLYSSFVVEVIGLLLHASWHLGLWVGKELEPLVFVIDPIDVACDEW